jgi:putative SOS response-associated peptidase YedK
VLVKTRDGTVGAVCGRTTSTTPSERVARLLDVDRVDAPELPLRWNVAPTQPLYALTADRRGARVLSAFRWGLVPHWSTDARIGSRLINARGETVAQRPAFREAVVQRRTAVVVDGFYEWHRPHRGDRRPSQPFYFHPADHKPLVFAGLWDTWHDAQGGVLRTCAIITTAANATMAPVHHRMPVLLSPETWDEWIRPGQLRPSRLAQLLQPAPEDVLRCHMVSTAVNSARNDGPELVAPVTAGVDSSAVELFSADALGRPPVARNRVPGAWASLRERLR